MTFLDEVVELDEIVGQIFWNVEVHGVFLPLSDRRCDVPCPDDSDAEAASATMTERLREIGRAGNPPANQSH